MCSSLRQVGPLPEAVSPGRRGLHRVCMYDRWRVLPAEVGSSRRQPKRATAEELAAELYRQRTRVILQPQSVEIERSGVQGLHGFTRGIPTSPK